MRIIKSNASLPLKMFFFLTLSFDLSLCVLANIIYEFDSVICEKITC